MGRGLWSWSVQTTWCGRSDGCPSRLGRCAVHGRKSQLVADAVITHDLGNGNLVIAAQPTRNIDRRRRHVQMERGAQFCQPRPLGHGFEIVHRLSCFDLDHALQPSPPVGRQEDHVWIVCRGAAPDGGILLLTRIDAYLVAAAKTGLQQADNAIVLELLADGPHKDWTHTASQGVVNPDQTRKSNTNISSEKFCAAGAQNQPDSVRPGSPAGSSSHYGLGNAGSGGADKYHELTRLSIREARMRRMWRLTCTS